MLSNFKPSRTRNLSLDILRGITILAVTIHHATVDNIPNLPELLGMPGAIYWRIVFFGACGVDMFFVMSGFLIGGILLSEDEKTGTVSIQRFFVRRGLRVWPSYYVLLLVLLFCRETNWMLGETILEKLKYVFIHGFYFQNYFNVEKAGPTWSLAVQEHFYTILPLILIVLGALFGRRWIKRDYTFWLPALCLTIIVGVLIARIGFMATDPVLDNHHKLTHFRGDSFFLGVILQFYYRNHSEWIKGFVAKHAKILVAVGIACLLPMAFYSRETPYIFTIGFVIVAIGHVLILMVAILRGFGRMEDSFFGRHLAFIGCCSYNIYLWQCFFPKLVAPIYDPIQNLASGLGSPGLVVFVQSLIYVCYAVAIGVLCTYLIEKPFIKLRSTFFKSSQRSKII